MAAKSANEGRDFSYSEQSQKLMTAEQVMGMKADELLLLVGNRNPLRAKQNLNFKSKRYRLLYDENPLN
jgi:type IV secretion system protein VirD4